MRKPNILRLNVFMRHKYTQKKKSKHLKMLMILDKLSFQPTCITEKYVLLGPPKHKSKVWGWV